MRLAACVACQCEQFVPASAVDTVEVEQPLGVGWLYPRACVLDSADLGWRPAEALRGLISGQARALTQPYSSAAKRRRGTAGLPWSGTRPPNLEVLPVTEVFHTWPRWRYQCAVQVP